jgi:hypothetical protein
MRSSEDSKRGIANLFIKKDNTHLCVCVFVQMEIHVLFVFNLYYDELTYTIHTPPYILCLWLSDFMIIIIITIILYPHCGLWMCVYVCMDGDYFWTF